MCQPSISLMLSGKFLSIFDWVFRANYSLRGISSLLMTRWVLSSSMMSLVISIPCTRLKMLQGTFTEYFSSSVPF